MRPPSGAASTHAATPATIRTMVAVVVANGSGPSASSQVVLRGDRPYLMTGMLCGESAERILAGDLRRTGFVAPHQAFGARETIASTASMGVTMETTSSARREAA